MRFINEDMPIRKLFAMRIITWIHAIGHFDLYGMNDSRTPKAEMLFAPCIGKL